MKFGHLYRDRLVQAGFPPRWIDSAISYNQLKKCIKRVRIELESLGLDAATLSRLLESADLDDSDEERDIEQAKSLRYEFAEPARTSGHSSRPVKPKLLFLVDEETGLPLDARLTPETRAYIQQLALDERLAGVRISEVEDESSILSETRGVPEPKEDNWSRAPSRVHNLIEIPLTSDSEFFTLLQDQLSDLVTLQNDEKNKLNMSITTVGRTLAIATNPSDRKAKQDLAHWRRLFELYLDSRVFFATNEQDHGSQNFVEARKRFSLFLEKAQKQELLINFRKRESAEALQQFLAINTELLQNIRFHEINQTAMAKILKSKQTPSFAGGKIQSVSPQSGYPRIQDCQDFVQYPVHTEYAQRF
jgi:E3 ubiquitin-protein ligase BAH